MSEHKDGCHCHHNHGHSNEYHEEHCSCGCEHSHTHDSSHNTVKEVLKYLIGGIVIAVGFFEFIPFYIPLVFALIGYVLFGFEVWRDMIRGFVKKKIFTEFTLMCVATLGAFAIGEYADAAALVYLYSLGESISAGAYSKSKRRISSLLEITPEYASVLRGEDIVKVALDEINVGDVVLILSGERAPVDGVVVEGGGYADTSAVTGEATLLSLYEGVECPSGAVLTDGTVRLVATERYENSIAERMKRAVHEAEKRKSVAERKISRFAGVFTPIAFAVAITVFAMGAVITGEVADWLRAAIMVLVVSCPCSMVISVPLAYFAGIGSAAKQGIIFRGGEVMDSVSHIETVVFDKTGTLTESKMSFDGVSIFSERTTENDFIELARAVLVNSSHTAALAFCSAVGSKNEIKVTDIENIAGKGIRCTVNGKTAIFGNARFLLENRIECEGYDGTAILGAYGGELLGRLEFSSRVKADAKDAIRDMRRLGVGQISIISGDSKAAVETAGEALKIDECFAECAPDEKLEIFEKIKKSRGKGTVAYCGDGLNDSAVIAAADVGIAMGECGSAMTVELADVVLMNDKLDKINTAIRISRRTSSVATSNIVLSLGIKIGVLILGIIIAGMSLQIPIELAVVADVGATLVTVLNSLRAGRIKNDGKRK